MFSKRVHTLVYYCALLLLVASLPYSVFTLSVAQITLTVNWILEGKFKRKIEIIRNTPSLWIIGLFYLVHLVWMINTAETVWGLRELRLKLPMLVLPFVIATSEPLSASQIKGILLSFVAAVFSFTLYSGYLIFGLDGKPFHSMMELSPIIWHIRLALFVVLSIFFMFWIIQHEKSPIKKWLYFPVIIWLMIFLFLFKSLTGIVIFIIVSAFLLMKNLWLVRKTRIVTISVLILFILSVTFYLTSAFNRFYAFDPINFSRLDALTTKGNPYWHDTTKRYVENGHYIYLYICEPELKEEWGKRSQIPFYGHTENRLKINDCVIRYLTSKGLRKDAKGLSELSNREIRFIEQGKTNFIDTNPYALYPRIYVSLWEVYNYTLGANPTGYSLAQRIEFFKTSLHIIQNNFWAGVGTGDIPPAFKKQFEADHSRIPENEIWWANNQFLTFFVSFGFIGFLVVVISLIAPPFLERKTTDYLFLVIFLVGFLSFMDEDTFETHPGISMFAIFYSLFLFRKNELKKT